VLVLVRLLLLLRRELLLVPVLALVVLLLRRELLLVLMLVQLLLVVQLWLCWCWCGCCFCTLHAGMQRAPWWPSRHQEVPNSRSWPARSARTAACSQRAARRNRRRLL